MNRDRYATGTPWEPVVGYSRAVRAGPFVFFMDIRPATSLVEVSRLITPEILVEIEADAVVSS